MAFEGPKAWMHKVNQIDMVTRVLYSTCSLGIYALLVPLDIMIHLDIKVNIAWIDQGDGGSF